jgi:hypothetical protein
MEQYPVPVPGGQVEPTITHTPVQQHKTSNVGLWLSIAIIVILIIILYVVLSRRSETSSPKKTTAPATKSPAVRKEMREVLRRRIETIEKSKTRGEKRVQFKEPQPVKSSKIGVKEPQPVESPKTATEEEPQSTELDVGNVLEEVESDDEDFLAELEMPAE